jgi:hypothetical protein
MHKEYFQYSLGNEIIRRHSVAILAIEHHKSDTKDKSKECLEPKYSLYVGMYVCIKGLQK